MSALEHRIPPPVVACVVAVGMWLVAMVSPALALDGTLRLGLVAASLVAAALFGVLGFRAFGRAKTTVDPMHIDRASALVTTGIYRLSRNPMYVGLTLLLCAWAIWLAAPWAAAGPLLFVGFITRFQIVPEERAMSGLFGETYAEYRRRVRRWL